MKILSTIQIREADTFTIANEPIRSIDLMERAATTCFQWLLKNNPDKKNIFIFCGKGNNGGDGLAIARMLSFALKYKIEVFIVHHSDKCSNDFAINLKKILLHSKKRVVVTDVYKSNNLPTDKINSKESIIIDAIFGSGLTKQLSGIASETVDFINQQKAVVVSIDVPSGLFCDDNSMNNYKHIVKADYTLTFQLPKLSFLFPENDSYIGKWIVLPIGLSEDFINCVETKNIFTDEKEVIHFFKKRNKFSHKGTYGHALLVSGGLGKMGASILSSRACLHSGVGLLITHVPKCGYEIIQTAIPEAMVSIDETDNYFSSYIDVSKYNAIAVGPGIGTEQQTQDALKLLIQNSAAPLIFDADAINILSENKTWLSFIPKSCIFTPHPKEFERLVGKFSNSTERIKQQREFSKKYHAYIIFKGAYTTVSCPDGTCYFNSTGNPGMATAGSGDVLTGILLALIAQGYTSKEASLLGVYIHGTAGDIAMNNESQSSLIASDIIDCLGAAFCLLEKK